MNIEETIKKMREELVSSLPKSHLNDDVRISSSIAEIKRLKAKIKKFQVKCDELTLQTELKIDNLRRNWKIAETEKRIHELETLVKLEVESSTLSLTKEGEES